MKRSMQPLSVTTASIPNKRKFSPEEDPENLLIKRLRTDDGLSWKEIATHLNDQRVQQGKPGSFTEAAVYGRFVRNAPLMRTAFSTIVSRPLRHGPYQTNSTSRGVV